MTGIEFLFLIIGMTLVTYFTRRALLLIPSKNLSRKVMNGLSFIPIGIFAGLIFPSLFIADSDFVFNPLYVIASVVCILMMKFKNNVFLSFGTSLSLVIVWHVFFQ